MRVTSRAFLALLLCTFALATAARATVTLTFSGTYDTSGTTVFGLTGSAVPFSYQITYDPALHPHTVFVPAGSTVDGRTLLNNWYGYSASGITALNVTFGTKTWTTGQLITLVNSPGTGYAADLYFDADISTSTPTRSDIFFSDFSGDLSLGQNLIGAGTIEMGNISDIDDSAGSSSGFSTPLTIASTVPEPGAALALCALGAALTLHRGRPRCPRD